MNPDNFGDDLASWLLNELQRRDIHTEAKPSEGNFGWHLDFQLNKVQYSFVLGWREGDETEPSVWIGWFERHCGLLSANFGGLRKNIAPDAVVAIHEVLSQTDKVHDVRWHFRQDFDSNNEENWAQQPL